MERIENRMVVGKKPKRLLHDLAGKKFHMLTVVQYYGISDRKQIYWKCICDCGNVTFVKTADLNYGVVKSCGCLGKTVGHNNYKYGCKENRLYHIWRGMKARCFNPNNRSYNHYGGRGITICDEWKNHFDVFEAWAINNGYSDELTIDRINVNGNYEPSNCRWATMLEQNNNKRNNVYLTENGETKTLTEWCRANDADRDKVKHYIKKFPLKVALEKGALCNK